MPSSPSPVVDIRLVARFERRPAGFSFRASSQPGHLLHLVIDGEVEQSCHGRRHRPSAGDPLWHHDDELVEGVVRKFGIRVPIAFPRASRRSSVSPSHSLPRDS